MTHLAPRQGLFAVVILASFCLHILVFVMIGASRQEAHYQTQATTLAKQLSQELVVPVSINDLVSISVTASRYQKDPAIAFIGVYDNQGKLITPIGNKDAKKAEISAPIGTGVPLGKIIIKPSDANRAILLGDFWLYILAVLAFHALIWFFYGHLARPDEAYENRIRDEVRKKLIANGIPLDYEPVATKTTPPVAPQATTGQSTTQTDATHTHQDTTDKKQLFGGLFDILKGNKSDDNAEKTTDNQTNASSDHIPITPQQTHSTPTPIYNEPATTPNQNDFSYYSNQKMGDYLYVQFTFIDTNNLLEFLGDAQRDTYLTLCNQLLEKTAKKVLGRPILSGVRLDEIIPFEYKDGKCIAVVRYSRSSSNHYARLALAGAMLTKLFPAVNQVVYDRHRENNAFALPIKGIASDETRREGALTVLTKRNEQSLLLLNQDDNNSILTHFNLAQHKEASHLYERECRIITTANADMLKQLTDLRNIVLLQD